MKKLAVVLLFILFFQLIPVCRGVNTSIAEAATSAYSTAFADVLAEIKDGMSDIDKIVAVHDHLVLNYEYDYSYSYYSADDFFTYKKGVCNAYALAFKRVMDSISIPCITVVGYVNPDAPIKHAWNMVKINGSWYHIDVTWDEKPRPDTYGYIRHDYFLLSDAVISDDDHKHFNWKAAYTATDTTYEEFFSCFTSPMEYYDGNWYAIDYGGVYLCSFKNLSKERLNTDCFFKYLDIYNDDMYLLDSSYYAYIVSLDELENFNPLEINRLYGTLYNPDLNGMYIDDGAVKYAIAADEYYNFELKDDNLYHPVCSNYYDYITYYSIDLSQYKNAFLCGENAYWNFDDRTGTLTICGSGEMWDWSIYKDKPWSRYKDLIKAVIIQDGITDIGSYAFHDFDSLTSVRIGKTIKSVGSKPFLSCDRLTDVSIADGVTFLGDEIFYGCTGLLNIELPDSITKIGSSAFCGCTSLLNIDIPEGVTYIGSNAFSDCGSLTDIKVDAKNSKYFSSDGVLFDKEAHSLICYPSGRENRSYYVPEGTTVIENRAFYDCPLLENIVLPEGVTAINSNSFYNCEGLRNIYLPKSITYINNSFYKCNSLTKAYYAGSKLQWQKIDINYYSKSILDDIVSFNSDLLTGSCQKNGISYEFTVNLQYEGLPQNAVLVASLYDENKRLIGLRTIFELDSQPITFSVETNEITEYAKIMLWNSLKGAVPLCNSYGIYLTN